MGRSAAVHRRKSGVKHDPTEEYFQTRKLADTVKLSSTQGHFARATIILTLLVTAIFYYWSLLGGAQQMLKWFGETAEPGNNYRKVILMIFYPIFCIRLFITMCVSNLRRKTIWTEFVTVYILLCGFLSFHAVYGAVKMSKVGFMDYCGIGIFIITNIAIGFYEHVQLKRGTEFSYPLANLILHHGMLTGWCFVSRAIFMFWWPTMIIAIFLLIVGHGSDEATTCEGCKMTISGYAARYRYCKVCRARAVAKTQTALQSLGVAAATDGDYMSNSSKCADCDKPINKSKLGYVSAMGKLYHPNCFKCSGCVKPIYSKEFYCKDGNAYCEECSKDWAKKCHGCHEAISPSDSYVLYHNAYHANCLKCVRCKQVISGGSLCPTEDARPMCSSCGSDNV